MTFLESRMNGNTARRKPWNRNTSHHFSSLRMSPSSTWRARKRSWVTSHRCKVTSTTQCPPRRQKAGQSFDEGVDGVSRRHCLLGDRQHLTTAIVGRGLEVEHGRVVPAVDPPPPDGEGEGAGQGRREVVVVVVLEDRVQSVALEKELLSPDAVAGHAG